MNFHSLKLPVKGKPLVLSTCTAVAEAQKNRFIGSQRKNLFGKFGAALKTTVKFRK